jgi:hypothetical protein
MRQAFCRGQASEYEDSYRGHEVHNATALQQLNSWLAGILGGLVAAIVAAVSPSANAPIMNYAGHTQACPDACLALLQSMPWGLCMFYACFCQARCAFSCMQRS